MGDPVSERDEDGMSTTMRLERDRLVQDALAELDEPYRSVLVLRYHDGHAPSEIARRRRVPESTVRTQVARGLTRLRAELDRVHWEEEDPRAAWLAALAPLVPTDGHLVGRGQAAAAERSAGQAKTLVRSSWTLTGGLGATLFGAAVVAGLVVAAITGLRLASEASEVGIPATLALKSDATASQPVQESSNLFPRRLVEVAAGAPALSSANGQVMERRVDAGQEASGAGASALLGGVVRLADGAPLEGVSVRLTPLLAPLLAPSPAPSSDRERRWTRTDAEGRFQFTGLGDETFDLAVETDLPLEGAVLAGVVPGDSEIEMILDAISIRVGFPEALRANAVARTIAVRSRDERAGAARFDGPSFSRVHFTLDESGEVPLLLPQGLECLLTYRSDSHDVHGLRLAASLSSGTYS
ncbi:MAG: sigma factor-like helix-turn-helix DNA-binding protein, partial [Planctomycetota bacterium]